jgi:peptidoglycan/xylan/chitin deacetylase (PgdA/CDA1 family)
MRMQIQKKKIAILMYHSICGSSNPKFKQFTVTPELFAEQMAYLHQHDYTPITVTQLINARSENKFILPEQSVVITFDDGFADFFTDALPTLKQHNFTATLYISTAFINGTSRWMRHIEEGERLMLTWDQLIEISGSGIECGAHTHSHPQLDTLPFAAAQDEIVRSKKLLEDRLGKAVFSFAYPYGYYTAQVRGVVQEAGYTSACAVRHVMSSATDDPFALARLMVRADTTVKEFAALLTDRSLSPVMAMHTMYTRARTPIWQLVRRGIASVTHLQERGLA